MDNRSKSDEILEELIDTNTVETLENEYGNILNMQKI